MRIDSLILKEIFGADDVSRTHDLLITNQLLYQLSYIGVFDFWNTIHLAA